MFILNISDPSQPVLYWVLSTDSYGVSVVLWAGEPKIVAEIGMQAQQCHSHFWVSVWFCVHASVCLLVFLSLTPDGWVSGPEEACYAVALYTTHWGQSSCVSYFWPVHSTSDASSLTRNSELLYLDRIVWEKRCCNLSNLLLHACWITFMVFVVFYLEARFSNTPCCGLFFAWRYPFLPPPSSKPHRVKEIPQCFSFFYASTPHIVYFEPFSQDGTPVDLGWHFKLE